MPDKMHKSHPSLAYLLVNFSTLLWASNITLGRALREQAGPMTLTAVRVTVAGLLFLALIRRLPPVERRAGRDWPWLLAMALTGVFGFPALLYLALRFTTASNASLINGAGPLMTALMAALILRERLRGHQALGAAISLAGVFLVIRGNGLMMVGATPNPGDLLMAGNVVLWSLYSVLARIVTRTRSVVSATAFSTWLALPFLYPAMLREWQATPPALTPALGLTLLYIGVFPAFIAFLAWNEGVRRAGPSGAMAFYNMLPVYGALLGALFLGESLGAEQITGSALVIAGGLIGTGVWQRPS